MSFHDTYMGLFGLTSLCVRIIALLWLLPFTDERCRNGGGSFIFKSCMAYKLLVWHLDTKLMGMVCQRWTPDLRRT
jgi:hypothetical protein